MEAEKISEILAVSDPLSAVQSKCSCCNSRRPYFDGRKYRQWCRPCALKWQRETTGGQKAAGAIKDFSPAWQAEIPERFQSAKLDDLPKKLADIFLSLPDDTGFYLWGEPGRGKTYSMAAFAKHLWEQGWDIKRLSYEALMLRIRDTYKPGSAETEQSVIQPYLSVGKLFVEDVGTICSLGSQESDFSLRTFLHILDSRIENCLATYITANKTVDELGFSFDGRVASRIQQACEVIEIKGMDRRLKNNMIEKLF